MKLHLKKIALTFCMYLKIAPNNKSFCATTLKLHYTTQMNNSQNYFLINYTALPFVSNNKIGLWRAVWVVPHDFGGESRSVAKCDYWELMTEWGAKRETQQMATRERKWG